MRLIPNINRDSSHRNQNQQQQNTIIGTAESDIDFKEATKSGPSAASVDHKSPSSSSSITDRLKLNAQWAKNHLMYGKWRKFAGKLPKIELEEQRQGEGGEGEEKKMMNKRVIWMLGKAYIGAEDGDIGGPECKNSSRTKQPNCSPLCDEFMRDFSNRIWLSYREGFAPILCEREGSQGQRQRQQKSTTDCGWGCMLRAAQMLMAETLQKLEEEEEQSCSIIRLFEDSSEAPFGLHSLLRMAQARQWDSPIGRWFSPSQAALLLKDALAFEFLPNNNLFPPKKVPSISVCLDNCVEMEKLRTESFHWQRPILLVIPLRLGTEKLTEVYHKPICSLFSLPAFVGLIGGRPKYAMYIVARSGNILLALDPHVVQSYHPLGCTEKSDNKSEPDNLKWRSFRCPRPTIISVEELDPSCAIAFLLRDKSELDIWIDQMAIEGLIELHLEDQRIFHRDALFTVVEKRSTALVEANPENGKGAINKPTYSMDFELL